MTHSTPSSPCHFSLAGNFSADEIQELLGVMSGEHQRSNHGEGTDIHHPDSNFNDHDNDHDNDSVVDDAKVQARSERESEVESDNVGVMLTNSFRI